MPLGRFDVCFALWCFSTIEQNTLLGGHLPMTFKSGHEACHAWRERHPSSKRLSCLMKDRFRNNTGKKPE